MTDTQPPLLYTWAGESAAFDRLLSLFYDRVKQDAVLGPIFAGMDPQHAAYVAQFIAEAFGGRRATTAVTAVTPT